MSGWLHKNNLSSISIFLVTQRYIIFDINLDMLRCCTMAWSVFKEKETLTYGILILLKATPPAPAALHKLFPSENSGSTSFRFCKNTKMQNTISCIRCTARSLKSLKIHCFGSLGVKYVFLEIEYSSFNDWCRNFGKDVS